MLLKCQYLTSRKQREPLDCHLAECLPYPPLGQCAGLVHGRFHPTPMPSHVHLNFTCNVVLVRRRAVVDTFERAIAAFSRPVDPAIETGMQQVREGSRQGGVLGYT